MESNTIQEKQIEKSYAKGAQFRGLKSANNLNVKRKSSIFDVKNLKIHMRERERERESYRVLAC